MLVLIIVLLLVVKTLCQRSLAMLYDSEHIQVGVFEIVASRRLVARQTHVLLTKNSNKVGWDQIY